MADRKQAEQLTSRILELRNMLSDNALQDIAARSRADIIDRDGKPALSLHLLGKPVYITYPDFLAYDPHTGESLPVMTQALLLYYLATADGTPVDGRWISFAEMPDGRFYNQAFQGYTGKELAKQFGGDLPVFERASLELGGQRIFYGDAAFCFQALPRVMMAVVYHQGDEDFPASCQVLFDASTHHYLPIDVCAILGSMLTRAIIKAVAVQPSSGTA